VSRSWTYRKTNILEGGFRYNYPLYYFIKKLSQCWCRSESDCVYILCYQWITKFVHSRFRESFKIWKFNNL